jgi:hypothetical protein
LDRGAHVDLRLPDGRVRQYSLCGNPADRTRYDIAIKREATGRGGSLWAHANLGVGAIAHVSAPRNNFPLAEAARRHVLVAGGIGVTPFVAMVRTLAREGAEFDLNQRRRCSVSFATCAAGGFRPGFRAMAGASRRRRSARPRPAVISMSAVRPGCSMRSSRERRRQGGRKRRFTRKSSSRGPTRTISPSLSTHSSRQPDKCCTCRPTARSSTCYERTG